MDLNLYLKFCGHEPTRPYFSFPIDDGKWSYCTDARILLRVPKFDHQSGDQAPQKVIEAMRGYFANTTRKV